MAEIIVSAFLTAVFEKLASADLINLARSQGIHSQLKKWNRTLTQIRAVLFDAGLKQITDETVRLWLHHLHDLAYDIDDVLDDLATEALRRKLSQASNNKVTKLVPTCFTTLSPATLTYDRRINAKLSDITAKLHNLAEEKQSLGLNENVGKSNKMNRRLETSLLDESRIVGRQRDKEALLGKLLGDEPCVQNVSVLPIVGLGGIGKTTLAQILYNEKNVKDHFELMAWVCVSDDFDIFKISKIIFHSVTGGNQDFADLNLLQVAIREEVSKKRFLLVLDDVWNESYDDWELLKRPFLVGAPGSKIIVTTRKTTVASAMGSVQAYPLQILSDEEAVSLFAQQALGERNFDSHPALKSHGEDIVKKCGGLPLALIAVGRILRTKANEEEWEELLNNEIWNSQNESAILPALRLSYNDLPPHLKQLFAYCSLFPKDYMFDKDELILLWMAEGFLYQTVGSKSMESLGHKYFEQLLSRSFFQQSSNEESLYVMHDLMNELSTFVAGEYFFRSDDKTTDAQALEKYRHMSFIRQKSAAYGKFKAFQKAKRLRTFLAVSSRIQPRDEFYLSNKILVELLPQLQLLRVLSLSDYQISEVPESICSLKHLRYLNLSRTRITHLPEQVGNLHNLQTLLMCGCERLLKLPNSFAKLINLRHLDISDTPILEKMPMGIDKLVSLQTLGKVIIEGGDGFAITDLKGLVHLCGKLSIKRLDKVKSAKDAKEVNLSRKKGLNALEMEWSGVFDDSRKETVEKEVLDELKPHNKTLRELGIMSYGGIEFPSWVGDPSFLKLARLTLRGCKRCTSLPPLGQLQSLKELFIEGMDGVKAVGFELLVTGTCSRGVTAFPSLEMLSIVQMQGLEVWSTNSGDADAVFPCLRELRIWGCPDLVEANFEALPSLQVLDIRGCCDAVVRSMVRVASSVTTLNIYNISGLIQLERGVIEYLKAVEDLRIKGCDELTYLWESEAEVSKILVNLRNLEVWKCQNLVCFQEKDEVNSGSGLTSLREVWIWDCPRLARLKLPYTLKTLLIWECEKLLLEKESREKSTRALLDASMSSLEFFYINKWPDLKRFPDMKSFVHLTTMVIAKCEGIESFPLPDGGLGFLPLGLRILEIWDCKNLKTFPCNELPTLASLTDLRIEDCPSMDDSFPCGVWPPNLSWLRIGGLKKTISAWGPQNFPNSLVRLSLIGGSSEDAGDTTPLPFLPSSLKYLCIHGFEKLESLSLGLQHLTSLEELYIEKCPKIKDLPEMLLPSLLSLHIYDCPKLRERCISVDGCSGSSSNRRDSYRPLISHIPCVKIDLR